jgi:hypothetical protein
LRAGGVAFVDDRDAHAQVAVVAVFDAHAAGRAVEARVAEDAHVDDVGPEHETVEVQRGLDGRMGGAGVGHIGPGPEGDRMFGARRHRGNFGLERVERRPARREHEHEQRRGRGHFTAVFCPKSERDDLAGPDRAPPIHGGESEDPLRE